jgi:hypothetical protein
MFPRLTLVLLLGACLCAPASSANAQSSVDVYTVAHGVRLALLVPRSDYPANALIKVTLTVQNVSTRPVNVGRDSNGDCESYSPHATVETDSGAILYPPVIPPGSLRSCPDAGGYAGLFPGETVTTQQYVVLRSGRLRARLIIPVRGGTQWLATPPLALSLYPSSPPAVRLHIRPRRLPSADIVRPRGARGPLYVVSNWYCTWPNPAYGSSATTQTSQVWGTTTSTHLTAGEKPCRRVVWWRAVAGWLGEPVATIRYGVQPGTS